MRIIKTSLQNLQDLVVNFSVCAYELPRINRSLAAHVRRAASGFLDHDSERRKVPRLGCPIERRLDRSFRDHHVLPESAERAPVAPAVPPSPHFRLLLNIFAPARS